MSETEQPVETRKIAIIGKAPSSVGLAPYSDPAWEVWILNTLGSNKEVPRFDRQFELHDLKLTQTPAHGGYYQWLVECDKPVYVRDEPPAEMKNGVRFPLGPILEHFANMTGGGYLTNSVSMEMALAIYEHDTGTKKVSDIGLWGVDMAQHGFATGGHNGPFTSEYARQRPSVEFWIGVAAGKGIKIHVPAQSDLLKCACIYGYQHDAHWEKLMARRKELQQRIAGAQQREQQSHDEALYLAGALEDMAYQEQWMWGGTADGKATAAKIT
jgi:hypothetical protein